MSKHLSIVSLLKQTSSRTQLKALCKPLGPIRSFSKGATFFRQVQQSSFRQTLKPQFGRSIIYQQQHWTSNVTSTAPANKEERIIYNNWLDHLPAKIAPYAFLTRIDKPIGTWLLFWPCGK